MRCLEVRVRFTELDNVKTGVLAKPVIPRTYEQRTYLKYLLVAVTTYYAHAIVP